MNVPADCAQALQGFLCIGKDIFQLLVVGLVIGVQLASILGAVLIDKVRMRELDIAARCKQ